MSTARDVAERLAELKYIHPSQTRDVEQALAPMLDTPPGTAREILEPVERQLREMIESIEAHVARPFLAPAIRKDDR